MEPNPTREGMQGETVEYSLQLSQPRGKEAEIFTHTSQGIVMPILPASPYTGGVGPQAKSSGKECQVLAGERVRLVPWNW